MTVTTVQNTRKLESEQQLLQPQLAALAGHHRVVYLALLPQQTQEVGTRLALLRLQHRAPFLLRGAGALEGQGVCPQSQVVDLLLAFPDLHLLQFFHDLVLNEPLDEVLILLLVEELA